MSISPPPVKRRRVDVEDNVTTLDSETSHAEKLQIYSWNINGIRPFIQKPITSFFQPKATSRGPKQENNISNNPQSGASLRDFLRRNNWPTILFLQEVKINPDDLATQRAVERAVRNTIDKEPDYIAHFCLPSDPHNARGFGRKIYGVCSIIRQGFLTKYKARVRTVDWDLEGRIQIIETQAGRRLSIWNIYAVNGTDNSYKDSETGKVMGTRNNRKLAVHKFLLQESKKLENEGYSVILAGDMNIARSKLDGHPNLRCFPEQHVRNRADFNKKFFEDEDGLKAIDTFRHVHGDKRAYTYYPRGKPFGSSCDRVDLIICSQDLHGNISDAGVLETSVERGPSDHCPLFAVFDFGSRPQSESPKKLEFDGK